MPNNSTTESQDNNLSVFGFYLYMFLLVASGSINTIANKLQNITISLGQKYNHSFFITFLMFVGESLCLLVFYLKKNKKNNFNQQQNISNNSNPNNNNNHNNLPIPILTNLTNGENNCLIKDVEKQNLESNLNKNSNEKDFKNKITQKPQLPAYYLMLPAFCDFLSSTVNTIGLTMMTGSSFQMMRGASILFVALFSKIFLRSKLFLHNYLALFLVISGLMLVGAANLVISPEIPRICSHLETTTTSVLGFVLIFFASIFVAFQFILEEQFTKKYNCHPLEIVGYEGVFGALFYIPILLVFQNVKCTNPLPGEKGSWTKILCTKNDRNEWILEDTEFAIRQNANDSMLLFYNISYALSIALLNYTGVTVTKLASAASRAVTDTIRTVVIWGFFMMPIVSLCNREHFNLVQLTGFIFLIFGTLVYNEILKLPFGFARKNDFEENAKDNNDNIDIDSKNKEKDKGIDGKNDNNNNEENYGNDNENDFEEKQLLENNLENDGEKIPLKI